MGRDCNQSNCREEVLGPVELPASHADRAPGLQLLTLFQMQLILSHTCFCNQPILNKNSLVHQVRLLYNHYFGLLWVPFWVGKQTNKPIHRYMTHSPPVCVCLCVCMKLHRRDNCRQLAFPRCGLRPSHASLSRVPTKASTQLQSAASSQPFLTLSLSAPCRLPFEPQAALIWAFLLA